MKVVLAYPRDGLAPDKVVDYDEDLALRLIREGRARPAEPVASSTTGKSASSTPRRPRAPRKPRKATSS